MSLQQYRPTTLAAMIADTSHYLAEQYDGDDVISNYAWHFVHGQMMKMIDALDAIVGDERDAYLMEAGADPAIIYEGAPA